ncbi:hypothetical protein PLICRDRAFT_178559 [Plicaturopsis crispa FD-325 SS-3]|nr:hypothetical protein PLICRDRAFT_178559 [Plicaturopsis crispa FD-325 SS-3]
MSSSSWFDRKTRLSVLLKSHGDDDADALALDRLLHGQSVIGKTSKTVEIDALRFSDKDVGVVGTLEYGQFGVIDVVNCRIDGRVYVRKSIEKRFALRTREQCSPQTERDILLRATKRDAQWAPHLLCAYQTPTHLNLVMDYAEGGTLWDVLESSPSDGRVPEADMKWWAPQIISAMHWCHAQGFVHRDIKPHNFVLTPDAHVLLIDFGSAAPLLPPARDGSQRVPKKHCLVPCGTCDYISPEILQAHEAALVAMEMEDEGEARSLADDEEGYGLETDWWSLGAMLYEMAYGVAPFFAQDIRRTYLKIMDHEISLKFNSDVPISAAFQDLMRRLLTHCDDRLGRRSVLEITEHPFFEDTNWSNLRGQVAPPTIHLPQFTYTGPTAAPPALEESTASQPFAFSAFFQSSKDYSSPAVAVSVNRTHSTPSKSLTRSALREQAVASFIGFSWGPTLDAFPDTPPQPDTHGQETPRPVRTSLSTPGSNNFLAPSSATTQSTPRFHSYPFTTPVRPNAAAQTPYQTLPRTSTVRRTAQRRPVSDREAMKQLVDCVGMSARKKVLESGRKPHVAALHASLGGTLKKELRFGPSPIVVDRRNDSFIPPLAFNGGAASDGGSEESESEGPPSPSPSPRPGSAMSMMSRRSQTPTISGSYSHRLGFASTPSLFASTPSLNAMLLPPATPHSSTPRASNRYQEDVSSPAVIAFDASSFDAFEERHGSLMDDISDVENRIGHLLMQIG